MNRSELEGIWLERARDAQKSMSAPNYIACEERHMVYGTCAAGLRTGESSVSLIKRWRVNAKQAKIALDLRGDLENPSDRARWEVMVEVNNKCADELEAIGGLGA